MCENCRRPQSTEDTTLIRYRLRLADLDRHLIEVACSVDKPETPQDFRMPSWIPGSYLLREFARHVVGIEATSSGSAIGIEKIGKNCWRCSEPAKALTVTATIYALDQSVRGNWLDRRRAFFNGPAVFLLPDGRGEEPVELILEAPDDPACADWRVATAMTPVNVDERGFGRYTAQSYDELIDHPVEIGDFASVSFEACGVPHRLVVAGRFHSDLERVAADLARLCATQIEFFGRPAPFDEYLFLGLAVGDGYGGLEHRASSSLIFKRDDLPTPGETGVSKGYASFLGLASHEYFHSWHVKRTRPEAFAPYRLDRRNHTRLLWVFEGITSYYQELMVLRSGLVGAKAWRRRVGEQLSRVYRTPGRFRQSISDSSFDAWDVLYKPNTNSPNASVSYYSKGALTALALDLTLRRSSDAGVSLDDVVRELWRRYGAPDIGVPEDGFEALAFELGGTGLENFFRRAVRGTEDLDLGALLAEFGVVLRFRAARGAGDRGGTAASRDEAPVTLGTSFRPAAEGLELLTVFDGGPAQRAGLNPGDVVVAIDRLKVNERNLKARLERLDAGARVTVAAFRGDELLEFALELDHAPADTCYLEFDPDADAAALARRRAWLGE